MIVFAIAVTVAALAATAIIVFANLWRVTSVDFVGGGLIGLAWLVAGFFWLAWAFK